MSDFSDDEITAFLDELLSAARMSEIEQTLRDSDELRNRVSSLIRRRDQGTHSVGEIWRRHRLSCPPRSELGSYLLDAVDGDRRNYIEFHVGTVGCRICAANLEDLEESAKTKTESKRRSKKFFQSSAGYLNRE